ncbi:MAG: putative bifunctional diguanylate cyclase/phosphodiesterase, partial [Sulfurifustaceae bacterium]
MFHLRRYFSVTSLIGVTIVVVGLLLFYREIAFRTLVDHETRNNVALSQVFANTLWPKYSYFITGASTIPRNELRAWGEMKRLRDDVLQQMKGLNVVKVKIYDVNGLTVFSTDETQIGEDKSKNAGFARARAGGTASEIAFRERFDTFERTIVDRNLISSYVPIRSQDSAVVEGVLEVYSDVSELVDRLDTTQWQIAGVVLGSLSLLYFFLFLIVRRADTIIRAQSEEERIATRAKLRHLAFHDPLTGLPNRAKFTEHLDRAIARAKQMCNRFAVLFVDLDQFKYINDSLGHFVGDLLLQAVGERLKAFLSEAYSVARLGGDEFIMIVSDAPNMEHVRRVAAEVHRAIGSQPYHIDGRKLSITPSIGISIYPTDGANGVELIKNADAAMYYAKEMGRNNYQFFTHGMNARALAVLSLEHSLRQALERGEFVLHYQPRIELANGRVAGAEALIRWRRPDVGLVSPAQFISIAEETGLIVPIGDWVLAQACRQTREWQDAGLPTVPVSVNVSALQFRQPDFPEKVAAALCEAGVPPSAIELEITETVIMHGLDRTTATMHRLKAMQVKLSIDDFGTGYSSLSYLKQFPIERLKIDQSFVRGLPSDPDDLAISVAVLDMAKTLKLKVMAEGVETREQLNFLRQHGCDEAQGHYFSTPLSAED